MDFSKEELREFALRGERPLPGQSLTHNPDAPEPYEGPPEFTSKDDAIEHFFLLFTEQKRFEAIMDSLEEGVPIMDLVELFLVKSFQDGEINPDMMLILAEPLAYMLLALAEKSGIKAKIVDDPDDPDDPEDLEEPEDILLDSINKDNILRSKLQTVTSPQDDKEFPMKEKIDKLPSLLDKETQ